MWVWKGEIVFVNLLQVGKVFKLRKCISLTNDLHAFKDLSYYRSQKWLTKIYCWFFQLSYYAKGFLTDSKETKEMYRFQQNTKIKKL